MEFKVSYKKGMGVKGADQLVFEGNLNVQHITAIRKCILNQLSESTALQVKVEKVAQLDLSFLQLLLVLKMKCRNEQMPIYYEFEQNIQIEDILTASGFGDLLLEKY